MKRYLRQFLEDLPKQTAFDAVEVILDHNDPEPEEIEWVREFQSRYPNHLKHILVRPVQPIGKSMNRCIAEASGELLAVWNVDDLRTPVSLEQQISALQRDRAVEIVYGNYVVVTAFGQVSGTLVDHQAFPKTELTRSMILGPFFMFRRSLVERAGYFDEQLRSGADFDLAIRLAFNGEAVNLDAILGYYLNEGRGASTRPNSLQPVERTVIELRYGIYDKIDYSFLPSAVEYNISYLLKDGVYSHVRQFVSNYGELMEERRKAWFADGIRQHYLRTRSAPNFVSRARNRVLNILNRI